MSKFTYLYYVGRVHIDVVGEDEWKERVDEEKGHGSQTVLRHRTMEYGEKLVCIVLGLKLGSF